RFCTLGLAQRNFGIVRRAMGEVPLGNIKVTDPLNNIILTQLQASCCEMANIHEVMKSLPVETALYRVYHDHHHNHFELLAGDGCLSSHGFRLLADFQAAVNVYA